MDMSLEMMAAFIGPFVAVLVLVPPARALALRSGFVDAPGGRKQHETAVPPIGGLVIFPVYMITALGLGFDLQTYLPLFIGLALLLVAGAVDDARHINPWLKFGAQLAASAIVVVFGSANVENLGNLLGTGNIELGLLSIPLSILAVALLINAINLMDGLDGLAGGKSFVVLLWLLIAAVFSGGYGAVLTLLPLLASLAGFLVYNLRHPWRQQASIFLGDAGSMGLGLVLAWFCIGLAQGPDPVILPISVAWVLALPVMDAFGQFYRRLRQGRHPFSPDRGHFHHHMVHAGIPVGHSTFWILTIGFCLGGVGYIGVTLGVPQVVLTACWVALFFTHIALSYNPDRYVRLFSKAAQRGKAQGL